MTLHALRRTAAILLLGKGVDVKTVQAVLGHARPRRPLDIDADSIPGSVERAMGRLDAAVLGVWKPLCPRGTPRTGSPMSESDLSAKQRRALVARMGAGTLGDAAARAEVGQRRLRRWHQQGAFPAAFRRLRRDARGAATAHLQNVSWENVEARRSILSDDAASPSARGSAARTLLGQA